MKKKPAVKKQKKKTDDDSNKWAKQYFETLGKQKKKLEILQEKIEKQKKRPTRKVNIMDPTTRNTIKLLNMLPNPNEKIKRKLKKKRI